MARRKIVAGNWKMNKTPSQAAELIKELIPMVADADVDVVICTPATDLAVATEMTKGTNIAVGAENMHWEESGAFTGEISADMLLDLGVKYVIIGHSERREYFAETDETVNKKVKTAIAKGLTPIICCGETLEQREMGIMPEHIRMQIKIAMLGVTADQADEVCGIIRDVIAELYDAPTAEAIRIQYGGSMKPANAAELMSKPNIDGGLIGGAALKAEDFTGIVKY